MRLLGQPRLSLEHPSRSATSVFRREPRLIGSALFSRLQSACPEDTSTTPTRRQQSQARGCSSRAPKCHLLHRTPTSRQPGMEDVRAPVREPRPRVHLVRPCLSVPSMPCCLGGSGLPRDYCFAKPNYNRHEGALLGNAETVLSELTKHSQALQVWFRRDGVRNSIHTLRYSRVLLRRCSPSPTSCANAQRQPALESYRPVEATSDFRCIRGTL